MKRSHLSLSPIFLLFMFVIFLLILQGCVTGSPSAGSRGRLSDAMDQASGKKQEPKEYQGPRKERKDTSCIGGFVLGSFLSGVAEGMADSRKEELYNDDCESDITEPVTDKPIKKEVDNPLTISGGMGLLKSDDLSTMINLDLALGTTDKDHRSEFFFGAAWASVDRTSELDDAIDNGVFLIRLGYNFKIKLSEDPQWNSPYFMVGGAYRQMWWSYENSITTSDGYVIGSDSLQGIEVAAGFGKNLFKHNKNRLGMEVFPSVIFWKSDTEEGFENDVFDPFFMLNVRLVYSGW